MDAGTAPDFSLNIWKNLFDPIAVSSGRRIKSFLVALNSLSEFASCQNELDVLYKCTQYLPIACIPNAARVNCRSIKLSFG